MCEDKKKPSGSKLKLLKTAELLRLKSDAEHPLTADAIISLLSECGICAERKSVYRDISLLKRFGMDIVRTARGFYIGNRMLTDEQLTLTLLALRSAPFISKSMADGIAKALFPCVSEHSARRITRQTDIASRHKGYDGFCSCFLAIQQAIAERTQLTLICEEKNSDGLFSQVCRRVTPYGIIAGDGGLLLVCCVHGESALRELKLSVVRGTQTVRDYIPISQISAFSVFSGAEYVRLQGCDDNFKKRKP